MQAIIASKYILTALNMKLDEAIRILRDDLVGEYLHNEYNEATRLGLEALERMREARGLLLTTCMADKLPSEESQNCS